MGSWAQNYLELDRYLVWPKLVKVLSRRARSQLQVMWLQRCRELVVSATACGACGQQVAINVSKLVAMSVSLPGLEASLFSGTGARLRYLLRHASTIVSCEN